MHLAGEVGLTTPNHYERLLSQAVSELRDCPAITVSRDELVVEKEAEGENGKPSAHFAEEAMETSFLLPELEYAADPAIAEHSPRFRKVSSHWRGNEELGDLTGEFRLPQFWRAVSEPAPPLAWEGSSEDEREFLAQLKKIDDQPRSGTGLAALVRLDETNPLEIWVWDARIGPLRMDLDYLGYVETLALTKGVYGWQYLFTDVSFEGNVDLHHMAESARSMLRVFPELFPHYDYAPLRERLAERL